MNKTILITGSSGMIGINLVSQIKKQFPNFNIITVDLKKSLYDSMKPTLEIDLSKKECVSKILLLYPSIDYIIHLAALANVSQSLEKPFDFLHNNFNTTLNIFELAKQLNAKVIFASSSSVYGDSEQLQQKENNVLNPLNPYAQSKLMNEQTANIYFKNFNISSIGFRFFTVFGEYNRSDMFIYNTIKKTLNKNPIILYQNGLVSRDFTYVQDVVHYIIEGINFLYTNKIQINLNIGSSNPQSVLHITNLIGSMLKINPIINFEKNLSTYEAKSTHSNNENLIITLGNYNFTPIEISMSNTVSWFLKTYQK